jgi:hypothetical protein
MEKQCSHCKEIKGLEHFGPLKTSPDKQKYICRECDRELHRLGYDRNPERLKKRSATNRWKARKEGLCLSCYQPLGERIGKAKYCAPCAAKNSERQIERRKKYQDACFEFYGGCKCACCGETIRMFLTLDHTNNDGSTHRRAILGRNNGGSGAFYCALVKAGFPEGIQVQCWNCNLGRNRNGGICPHKEM